MEDTIVYNTYYANVGDTIRGIDNDIVVERISYNPDHPEYDPAENDFGVSLVTSFYNREAKKDSTVETALGLRGPLVYKYPEKIESFGVRVRPADTLMSNIAIEARLKVTRDGVSYPATPIYVIRGNLPMSIKHYIPQTGTHIRFSSIDPVKETFGFKVAQQSTDLPPLAIEVAEQVTRSDLLLLEAKIFPGISIFWSGTIMMMCGLLMAWLLRIRSKKEKS